MEETDDWERWAALLVRSAETQSSPPSYREYDGRNQGFSVFPSLPAELRMRIWEAALEPRIVRWKRTNVQNVFTGPSKSLPLMAASRESREAAFLYGKYQNLGSSSAPLYFSPKIDYLWFDPGWMDSYAYAVHSPEDPLEQVLSKLSLVRNIMVHPNWSGGRKRPTVLFGKLPMIQNVLVGADEKSIGVQSQVMLETVKGIKCYYAEVQSKEQATKIPYIAVGCLGWTGEARRNLHHGREDCRQLVKVLETKSEMNAHLAFLRAEEWKFTQNRFDQPQIIHKLRWAREKDELERKLSTSILEAQQSAS